MTRRIRLLGGARLRRTLALVLGGWLLFLVGEVSPHLVHHLFDTEGQSDCPFFTGADHTPAASVPPVALHSALPTQERPDAPPVPLRPPSGGRPTSTRAPPTTPLALA